MAGRDASASTVAKSICLPTVSQAFLPDSRKWLPQQQSHSAMDDPQVPTTKMHKGNSPGHREAAYGFVAKSLMAESYLRAF
jgi:hypothetical protein